MINFLKTHYSFESFNKPDIVDKLGSDQVALIDTNLGGIVKFYSACKEKGIRPIIGLSGREVYLARNKTEYKELLSAVSENREPKCLEIVGLPHHKLADKLFKQYYPPVLRDDALDEIQKYLTTKQNDIVIGLSRPIFEAYKILNDLLLDIADQLNLETIKVNEIYYKDAAEANDHLIQICYKTKSTIKSPPEEEKYKRFFLTDQFGIGEPTQIDAVFEDYEILGPPNLPTFQSDKSPDDKIRELCRMGWQEKISKISDKKPYIDRINQELDMWTKYGLSSYFLIMADIVKWCTDQGWLLGPGRGSGAGCLTTYLLNITHVDPIKHGLLLERFHNPSRVGDLPDLDQDVPKFKRADIINYIKNKYGEDSVSQIITFSQLGGRSALKAVLRFTEKCGFTEMNQICDLFPEPAKVEDQMKAAKRDSLILWSIETYPEMFSQYVRLEDGKFVGDYAEEFSQAIRIENTIVDYGQHASGIIVYNGKIKDVAPLMMNKDGTNLMCGLDLDDAQKVSLVKLDILGLSTLDRLMLIMELINEKAY